MKMTHALPQIDNQIAAYFGVSVFSLHFEDIGADSLTVCVNGTPFDVFFDGNNDITHTAPSK